MTCKECKKLHGEGVECAFEGETFSSDNWNCWTLSILREKYWQFDDIHESLDDYATLIPYTKKYENWFVFMGWYKSRGKTDQLIDMATLKPVTLEFTEKLL